MGQAAVAQQPDFTWERVQRPDEGTASYCKQILDVAGAAVEGFRYVNLVPGSACVQSLPFPHASDHKPVTPRVPSSTPTSTYTRARSTEDARHPGMVVQRRRFRGRDGPVREGMGGVTA